MALLAVSVLTIFAVHLGSIVRQKVNLMSYWDSRRKLSLIAEAGVRRAFAELRKTDESTGFDSLNESWSGMESAFRDITVGDGTYSVGYPYREDGQEKMRYGMMDEESKIDINTADVQVLTGLLAGQGGMNFDSAMALAYCIVDWRDADSFFQHPQHGAEDEDYKDLQFVYESKDADFEIPEELLLVRGMTEAVFNKIKRFVTVYTEGVLNINTVPKEVLSAHGLSDDLADSIVSFRKGVDLMEGTADDGIFLSASDVITELSQTFNVTAGDMLQLSRFLELSGVGTTSEYFMVRSLARLKGRNREMETTAVTDRDGRVRYWREQYRTVSDDGTKSEF